MLQELFGSGTLNIIYAIIVAISFAFALVSLLGVGISEAFDFSLDADGDADIGFVSISPFALAMFGATFGLTGLVTRTAFEMNSLPSLLWSSLAGFLIGLAAQGLFIYVLSPSKSSHFSLVADSTGREAEVIITIPAEGLGQIAFDNVSGRVTLGARSVTGNLIPRGQQVQIKRVTGRIATVQPIEQGTQLEE